MRNNPYNRILRDSFSKAGTVSSVPLSLSTLEARGWPAGEGRLKRRFSRWGRAVCHWSLQLALMLRFIALVFQIFECVDSVCPAHPAHPAHPEAYPYSANRKESLSRSLGRSRQPLVPFLFDPLKDMGNNFLAPARPAPRPFLRLQERCSRWSLRVLDGSRTRAGPLHRSIPYARSRRAARAHRRFR